MEALAKLKGKFSGEGINHEGQHFIGHIEFKPVPGGNISSITFTATGKDGKNFHTENTLMGPDLGGVLSLFVMSNNHQGVTPHIFRRTEDRPKGQAFIFGFNDPKDKNIFREEISIELWQDGSVGYRYFWGMPGGDFKERSGARMKKA